MFDFEYAAGAKTDKNFFRNLDTIANYVEQRRRLITRADLFMVTSFIGAALIVAGGFPAGTQISVLGFEGPSNLISIPLLAALVAGLFNRFIQSLVSLTMIGNMIDKLLSDAIPDGAEFVMARYDAGSLWANLLRRRRVGYQSPKPHIAAAIGTGIVGLSWLILHTSVTGAAMWFAMQSAYLAEGVTSFSFFIALMAAIITFLTVLIFLFGFVIPLPYPMSKEMEEHLAREAAELPGPQAGNSLLPTNDEHGT